MAIDVQERQWQDVISRNRQADGQFVYAVSTTGIYCRPSCASRLPRPEHVEFFAVPALAEGAGYRPCKRCNPRQASITSPGARLVQMVCAHIQAHAGEPDRLTLEEIGRAVGYDPQHVQAVFSATLGITPRQYAQGLRADDLKTRLRQGTPVVDAIYGAGYGSASRVYERADDLMGMTPATYRKGGIGASIRYTVVTCDLGYLLVAMTRRGICAVGLYDDQAAAEAALRAEYPRAEIEPDDDQLQAFVEDILAYIETGRTVTGLPLDIQATAFQLRVWEELRHIPRGETRTYSEVAAAIGQPSASRAVARACASNVAAIVIPCHRVIGKDGQPSGYRWGVERKRALLEHEGSAR